MRRSFRRNISAEDVMSGLSRQLPWAAACLAALCVLTAAQSSSPDPNTTTATTLATTKIVPTSLTVTPVTIPAQGGRRPNGLPALARPPPSPAEPPALPAVRAGPGRAALQQHGGPSESSRGPARVGGGGGAPRGEGAAEPPWPLPPRSV